MRVYASGGLAYGCAAGSAGTYKLGTLGRCIGAAQVGPVKVAGKVAAYGLKRCGTDAGSAQVVVRRLTDGKIVAQRQATTAVFVEAYQTVDSLVVKSDSAVAWIATVASIIRHGQRTEVHRLDRHGFSLLDSGSSVASGSLALRGSTVSWHHGKATRHATLS